MAHIPYILPNVGNWHEPCYLCKHTPRTRAFVSARPLLERRRSSNALTRAQVIDIRQAAQRAKEIGAPLNRHVTVHFGLVGIADRNAAQATARMLTLCRDWLGYRGIEATYIYVRENAPHHDKGSHVHVLLHWPPELGNPQPRFAKWLKHIAGTYGAGAIRRTRPIGPRVTSYRDAPALYDANLIKIVDYLTKGIAPRDADVLAIEQQDGGRVIGKRCGISRNLMRGA